MPPHLKTPCLGALLKSGGALFWHPQLKSNSFFTRHTPPTGFVGPSEFPPTKFLPVFFEKYFPGYYKLLHDCNSSSKCMLSKTDIKNQIVNSYKKNQKLEIIEIIETSEINRIRGKVCETNDWISLKNTEDGFVWVEKCDVII